MTKSSTIRGSLSALAAGALLLSMAAPATAAERGDKKDEASAASGAGAAPSEKKICLSPTVSGDSVVTGSLLSKRQCRTKAEWEARGVQFKGK